MAETGKLGSADSLLGNLLPAFAGVDDALPSTGGLTGRLGSPDSYLADLLLALEGQQGAQVINVTAASVLTLAHSASCVATIVGHPSPLWALGGSDSELGDDQLAFTGPDDPVPALGTKTGRLGAELGGVVLALGGVLGAQVINVTATSTIALTSSASCVATIVGHPAPSWTLGSLTETLGDVQPAFAGTPDPRPMTGDRTGKLGTSASTLANVRLALAEEEGDSSAKTWNVTAQTSVSLSSAAALTNFSRRVFGSSTVVLSGTAHRNVARPVAGTNTILLTGLAHTKVSRVVAAQNTITLSVGADLYPWVITEVGAESVLDLGVSATGRHARFWPAAESTIVLNQSAYSTLKNVFDVLAASSVELTAEATGRHAHFRPSAGSIIDLTVASTGRHAHFRPTAQSAISLTSTSSGRHAHFRPSALTTIVLTQFANGFIPFVGDVDAESVIALSDEATGRHSHFRSSALSTIAVAHSAVAKGVFLRDGESVLQTITEEYDPELDEIVTTIVGLQDAATCTVITSRAGRSVIPLRHTAGAVRVKPTAISVSAESVLELTDQLWDNEVGEAFNTLTLSQTATVLRSNPTGSVIELTDTAGVSVVRKRSASSVIELKQSVSFSIVRADVLYKYHPYVGEGATDAPTPPPATLAGPRAGVTDPFKLVYPATGTVTDSLVIRAPNLGNKDRLVFNRISRETRGGTLIVYADPIWPKIQTLALNFSGLTEDEKDDLLEFFDSHLGQEIGLLDWEHRYWKGVIMTPDDPIVQDTRDTYSASFEFEGELDPTWSS